MVIRDLTLFKLVRMKCSMFESGVSVKIYTSDSSKYFQWNSYDVNIYYQITGVYQITFKNIMEFNI